MSAPLTEDGSVITSRSRFMNALAISAGALLCLTDLLAVPLLTEAEDKSNQPDDGEEEPFGLGPPFKNLRFE